MMKKLILLLFALSFLVSCSSEVINCNRDEECCREKVFKPGLGGKKLHTLYRECKLGKI